ncbi:hypothetical protein V5O48_019313 [Marasmius crinis-equi]|uniref:Uncharacterized protein n=1 Tax=Marasmius crinis-equi TaxID=585013 RepID=A0ABR3EIQ3_9AGAR
MLQGSSFRHAPSQSILLPHLQRLVYKYDVSDGTIFLDSISTPSLTELSVPADPSEEFTHGLLRFLDRSGCHLQSLECDLPWSFDGKDADAGWPAILSQMPGLKSLYVRLSASLSWNGNDPLDELCNILCDLSWARELTYLRIRATAGGWRDLEREEMEDVTGRFLALVESRAPDNHAPTVVPLRGAQLELDCYHNSGWTELDTVPLTGHPYM